MTRCLFCRSELHGGDTHVLVSGYACMGCREQDIDELLLKLRAEYGYLDDVHHAAKEHITKLESELAEAKRIVGEQAKDDGCWFIAESAAEAYLQQELRRLHAAIEGEALPGI